MGKVTSIRKQKLQAVPTGPARPFPPALLIDREGELPAFCPAPEAMAWVEHHLLDGSSPLFNPDHKHLKHADIEVLWASSSFAKQGRIVLGQAEMVAFRAGGWTKQRQEAQMLAWFGHVPQFLITLAADYCAAASDIEFAALIEHELYHVGQKRDEFGNPAFDRDGNPKLGIRGHDVEEFVGVVRRYGVPATGMLRDLVDVAARKPEVEAVNLAASCGTCLERAA